MKLYKLCTDADNGLVLNTEIEYFHTHFIGKPMQPNWQTPSIEILNKSKPVRDFVSWMRAAPVVSEKARTYLDRCIGNRVEFLPLIQIKRKQLYAVNVLNVLDCLDIVRSDVLFDPSEPGRIVDVIRFVFEPNKLPADPVIFKIPEDTGSVFVSQAMVDVIVACQLTGSLLLNPSANPFSVVLPRSPDVFKPV